MSFQVELDHAVLKYSLDFLTNDLKTIVNYLNQLISNQHYKHVLKLNKNKM